MRIDPLRALAVAALASTWAWFALGGGVPVGWAVVGWTLIFAALAF